MINGLYRLREELHNKILVSRSIESMILHPRFERLWLHSEPEQKATVRLCIKTNNKLGILKWMREHPSIDIGEKPLRDLYPIAKELRIKNYSRLQRDDLIIEIKRAEDNAQQGIHASSDQEKDRANVSSTHLLQSEGGPSHSS